MKMSTTESTLAIRQSLALLGIKSGAVIPLQNMTSSITTFWGVKWDQEFIARDLMQNFYDANRLCLDEVQVNVVGSDVVVTAPNEFNLNRLFYLGSEKDEESVGEYGEGFKAAAVCLLRDHGVSPVVISDKEAVRLTISSQKVTGTELNPVVYEFHRLDEPFQGTALILPRCERKLITAMKGGMTHFFHKDNPLLDQLEWTNGEFSIYSSMSSSGHVFYKNLKRGDIENIPVVLVIHKHYEVIEKKISKDRDRNAFGEELMSVFYNIFARYGTKFAATSQAAIVRLASRQWQTGHPLLSAISRFARNNTCWSTALTSEMFGDNYFAETRVHYSDRDKELADQLAVDKIEQQWKNQGKKALPAYFKVFGLICAEEELKRIRDAARKESQQNNARKPTYPELECISLLTEVLQTLAPEVCSIFSKASTKYKVILSAVLLGELKRSRTYRSWDVYLSDKLFAGDFAMATATFLHEHAHIFGADGSRGFTDSLTEMLEEVIRHRQIFEAFEERWNQLREKVRAEHTTSKQQEDELEDWLTGMGADELRTLIRKISALEIKKIRGAGLKSTIQPTTANT